VWETFPDRGWDRHSQVQEIHPNPKVKGAGARILHTA
jgi:hypothetical protein